MKIQLMSDLHLEAQPDFVAVPAAGADLLVLAGDIGSYQASSQLADTDFGLGQFSPRNGWPTPVLFVPGNHEYDSFDFDVAHQRLRETCERLEIIWLERQVTVIGGIRFVGTTLWSDFDVLAQTAPPAQQLKARGKAFRAADFYLKKAGTLRDGQPWLAAQMREHALVCQAWLRPQLAVPHAGTTVVITHFAPSLHSADPRYGLNPGTAGFCNGLDDLLSQAQWWLHGHLHAPSHYTHRGCRVVANPLGYARKQEQAYFEPSLLLSIC